MLGVQQVNSGTNQAELVSDMQEGFSPNRLSTPLRWQSQVEGPLAQVQGTSEQVGYQLAVPIIPFPVSIIC
jgi:hypothetical protein